MALSRVDVGVERRGPAVREPHRRPAVDEAHEVEGAAEHRRIGAHRDRSGVRHVRAVQGLDDAPLAHDALVPRGRRARRRDADGAVKVAAADLVDLVLRSARDVTVLDRLALAWEPFTVHPRAEALDVDAGDARAHRLPTSCSRYSAYFSRASARSFGTCRVGHMSSLAR